MHKSVLLVLNATDKDYNEICNTQCDYHENTDVTDNIHAQECTISALCDDVILT